MAAYFLQLTGIYWRRWGDKGNRLNLASGTGFIRSMVGRSVIIGIESCARAARGFAVLALVALALGACSLFDKDAPIAPEEPADKLQHGGPPPSKNKEGRQGGGKEVRRGPPATPLFGRGAQGADHVALRLFPARRLRRLHQSPPPLRHAASGKPGCGLR